MFFEGKELQNSAIARLGQAKTRSLAIKSALPPLAAVEAALLTPKADRTVPVAVDIWIILTQGHFFP
jgi:hypothetical protein